MGGRFERGYGREIALLPISVERATELELLPVRKLLHDVAAHPAFFVASGGALAVARFAADLHSINSGNPGRAITPLEFAEMDVRDHAIVVISASGRNPDARLAMNKARAEGACPIGLLTCRAKELLPPELTIPPTRIVVVPSATQRDGFLATNSIVAMATTLARCWTDEPVPVMRFDAPSVHLRPHVIILYGPAMAAAAVDLETRLSETGLASAQIVDYRNFAHGRHFGFWRRIGETTILALRDPESRELSDATLAELPEATHLVRLSTKLPPPFGLVELLCRGMRLIMPTASEQRVALARPGVPPFGRRLYHLPIDRRIAMAPVSPVTRKLRQLGAAANNPVARAVYQEAFQQWTERAAATHVAALVLDYDGTCCTTEDRFDLPPTDVRSELLRLLSYGLTIGFASGRGKSLYHDLREWVPESYWGQIRLALYNGGLPLGLHDPIEDQAGSTEYLKQAQDRLLASPLWGLVEVEQRRCQMGIKPRTSLLDVHSIAAEILGLIAESPALPLKVLSSGHSVDVVSSDTSKATMVRALETELGRSVLAIGDQGQLGGNDFELLASTWLSLSVDRCSPSASRCWNLDRGALGPGPALLVEYLKALVPTSERLVFSWSVVGN